MNADQIPLPEIQEIFDEMAEGVFFTTLDRVSRYRQKRISKQCKQKIPFVCRYGTFQFEVMPVGLVNALSTFHRMMVGLLGSLPLVRAYRDNLVIFSLSLKEHVCHIPQVVALVASHGLKIRFNKCEFAKEQRSR